MKQEIKEGAAPVTPLGNGGNAFPCSAEQFHQGYEGVSLRDYFAAKAMQGLLANPNVIGYNSQCGWAPVNCNMRDIAAFCIAAADDMIKARAEGKGA